MLHAFAAAAIGFAAVAAPVRTAPIAAAAPITWKIDLSHSDLTFRIRHLVSRVTGTVNAWSGTIVADPAALGGGSVEFTGDMSTIDTRNEKRDGHLKGDEFFDVAKYPTVTFRSTSVTAKGSDLVVVGNLTMKGVTKSVTLNAEYLGTTGAPEKGKQKIGFRVTGRINRLDYGVTWNRAAEGGGVVLGDDVDLDINIEAVRDS